MLMSTANNTTQGSLSSLRTVLGKWVKARDTKASANIQALFDSLIQIPGPDRQRCHFAL